MELKWIRIKVTDILLLVVGIVFFIGMLTFLKPCEAKTQSGHAMAMSEESTQMSGTTDMDMEDAAQSATQVTWMTCHWAGQAVTGVAALLFVLALLHTCIPDERTKLGIGISMIPTAILAALIPGNLIGLCGMKTMRCRSLMLPGVVVFSVLIVLLAIVDVLTYKKSQPAAGDTRTAEKNKKRS